MLQQRGGVLKKKFVKNVVQDLTSGGHEWMRAKWSAPIRRYWKISEQMIVLIGHLNKKEGTKGLYRSLGSIDVVAAARSVLQVERDQKDTDIRIVRQIKNSLAPSDGEIRFSITAEMGFQWLECKSTFVSSEQPKVPEFESKTEKAAYLIKKLLSDGDMRAREIYMRMKDEGISRRTAENTKKELGIRSYRKMRQWYWSIHTGE